METLLYYRHNVKIPHPEIPFHYATYDEITAVFSGQLEYSIDGVEFTANAGDVIFIKKGSSRARKPIECTNYVSLNFSHEQDLSFPPLIEQGLTDIIRLFISSMDAIFEFTHDLKDERFTLLLQCVIKQLEKQIKAEKEPHLVAEIKKYIKNHLTDKLTLESICSCVFFSPTYCENVFKKETSFSIIDYALNEKIKMAKTLLIEGSFSLKKISEQLGFQDYNYFSRLFKKRVGLSPLSFKKSQVITPLKKNVKKN